VGKTTTSASFASGLALAGHKTAVIDWPPRRPATRTPCPRKASRRC
jgi:cellulose biosynthesis protein BcsQ